MEEFDCPGIFSNDRELFLEVTNILKPFGNATLLLQHDYFYNIWLKRHLDAIKCDYSSNDETDELVSMLDPHFKLLWTAPENTEELVSLLQKNFSSDEINSDTFSQNKKHKSDDFFNFLPKSTSKCKRHQLKAHNLCNVI